MMSKIFYKSVLAAPALLGATLLVSAANAAETSTAKDLVQPSAPATQIAEPAAVRPANVMAIAPVESAVTPTKAVAPTQVALTPVQSNAANAPSLTQLASYSSEGTGNNTAADQVTSVSQLSDVQPSDWAFQALQSLVERYGCIVGYPDRTFRGNRALSRYEFAAGLNACMDRINELIAAGTADLVKKEDLEALQKLQEQFAAELATLRGRVDALEARTAKLEAQQFSTTTKLNGEAIFNIAGVLGDKVAVPSGSRPGAGTADLSENTIFSDRVRLNLDTSFTGKDRLRTRLEANNTTAFNGGVTGTNMTRLGFDSTSNVDNSVQLGKLFYRFPLGDKTTIIVDAIGGEFYENFNTLNPYFQSSGTGAISRFGRFNPIYRLSNTGSGTNTGSGLSAIFKFNDALTISGGYLARNANDPTSGKGLFDGTYAALGQINFQASKAFGLGLTYVHSYYSGGDVATAGSTGSGFANSPFTGVPTSANSYGAEASFRFSPKFTISGWAGYTAATAERGIAGGSVITGDRASIWNWAVTLAFPDLGKKGSVAGIIFGMQPKVTENDYSTGSTREDLDTAFHLEGLYRYQLNDHISITPGLLVIFNPQHNDNNDNIYVGTIRTTFQF